MAIGSEPYERSLKLDEGKYNKQGCFIYSCPSKKGP